MKIKCGDIVFLPHVPETHFGEVGPGKFRESETVLYEIFPLVPDEGYFVYGDSCWVPKEAIGEHYTVKSNEDFHYAWISLGFQPLVSENDVRFEKLFDHEHIVDSDCVDSLSSDSDSVVSMRSNDSWSTQEDDVSETDSFIDREDTVHETSCPGCDMCQERQDTEYWFRRDWHPTDPTESAVKSIIERIEEKYT
jgi:hypothetical protein